MKDQVDALVAKGAGGRHQQHTERIGASRRHRGGARGRIELVYVAPERFSDYFLRRLAGADIRLLAIDEAHRLSQWGHDFRPDYLRLGRVRAALGNLPTVALTAGHTRGAGRHPQHTRPEAQRFIQGFDRPNLSLKWWQRHATKTS